jgi:hypothetical protein
MQDCEHVDAALPVRQGDVLKRVRGDGAATLAIVVTADCDIANEKFGEAGLACVQMHPLADHVLGEHARGLAQGQLKRRFEKATEWINKRWSQMDPENVALSDESVQSWILASMPEEIEAELNLPVDESKSFLKRESAALRLAQKFIDAPVDRYYAIDALCALQPQTTSRSAQLKTVFGTLNPKALPLDLFYVSSVPGEPGLGFIAKLRALTFIPFDRSFTSIDAAKDVENSFVRVGRLAPTFRHALAQQFGLLFARIGMPKSYEVDRDAAFELIADQITAEMGEQK